MGQIRIRYDNATLAGNREGVCVMTENLIVYGATCVWWDSIDKAAIQKESGLDYGLPCCPHCGGVLFQQEETTWNKSIAEYENNNHPGYSEFIAWLRGKCFPTQEKAEAEYKKQKAN